MLPLDWASNPESLLSQIDTVIFDCDGVLWRGTNLIDGATETIKQLRALKKRVIFVTNNSSKSREQYIDTLKKFNIPAKKEDILCSAYGAASYLESVGFKKKAYIIGADGIGKEMQLAGIRHIEARKILGQKHLTVDEMAKMKVDPEIGAVVVGADVEFTYTKNAYALKCFQQDKNCLFVCTNQDSTFPGNNCVLPGGGTCVIAVSYAAGKKPVDIGKPHPWLFQIAMKRFNLDKSRTLMVGDRINTDIQFGKNAGVKTLLVFTGVDSMASMKASKLKPDYFVTSVKQMINQSSSL